MEETDALEFKSCERCPMRPKEEVCEQEAEMKDIAEHTKFVQYLCKCPHAKKLS